MKSEGKYIRILIDPEHPVEFYTDFLVQITGEAMNRYPKEWDCCSRYMECSDAKSMCSSGQRICTWVWLSENFEFWPYFLWEKS